MRVKVSDQQEASAGRKGRRGLNTSESIWYFIAEAIRSSGDHFDR